jgi:hypothetical protein
MGELANGVKSATRKARVPARFAGKRLVFDELKKRGFDAQLGPREHEMLVRAANSPPTRVWVKTAHVTPWYVRRANFGGCLANQVTVFVLIGLEKNSTSARFFVVKNEHLLANFRATANWESTRKSSNRKAYGYIDSKSVKQYEDNWMILR